MAKGRARKTSEPEEELPEFLTGTARERFNGPQKDRKTKRRIVIEPGENVELPYALALRLHKSGKLALTDDEREGAKDAAKQRKKNQQADDERELLHIEELRMRIEKRIEERDGVAPDTGDAGGGKKGKGKGKK